MHRQRKRKHQFLSNCYRHHKSMGRSWVIHIDVDEYVLFNNKRFDEPKWDENGKRIVPSPERGMLPTFGKRKRILDVVAAYPNVFGTCVGMVRLLFGNKRKESSSIPKKMVVLRRGNKGKSKLRSGFVRYVTVLVPSPKRIGRIGRTGDDIQWLGESDVGRIKSVIGT